MEHLENNLAPQENLRRSSQDDMASVELYHRQPSSLPIELNIELAKQGLDDSLLLFAMVDLNDDRQIAEYWLLLGARFLTLAERQPGLNSWRFTQIERSRIKRLQEFSSMSLNRLVLYGEEERESLLVIRFSARQKRMMGHIIYCLEQGLKVSDADHELSRFRDRDAQTIYAESMLAPIKEAQASMTVNRFAVVWRLLRYLIPYRRQVAYGLLAAIGMTMVSLLPPFLTGWLIDRVLRPFDQGLVSKDEAFRSGFMIVAALAIVLILREGFSWIRLRLMSTIGEFVASDLRVAVYSHLHRLSIGYFSSKQTGSIISRVSSDTDRIWDFIAFGVAEVMTSLLMMTALGAVLLALDWRLGLVVTIPIPFVLLAIYWHGQKMQKLFLRAWRKWSHLTDCLSDTIPGVRVVKAFHRERYETEKFSNRNSAVLGEFIRIHTAWTSFWPLLMLTVQAIILTVWILALPRILSGPAHTSLSAGVFISFVLYMTMFVQPIEVIGQMARMVNRATSSAYRVFEVLDTQPKQISDIGLKLPAVSGHIQFKNVYFSYDGVRPILRRVSFAIQPGEMIGLVGPSGSGKSTIVNLLARFYDCSDGSIEIDGVDLKKLHMGHTRQQIGMVLQDSYLFHGSIVENIRYGRPDATFAQVIESAKAAHAHDFIMRMPHGYDTMVGERGHTLSGGERQRVSIARAILLDPRILILDEATSAVDTETERQIQAALDELIKGRTVVAIAHRLSTLKKADRLLVIKEGELIEQGRHEDLMKIENGVFATLANLQIV